MCETHQYKVFFDDKSRDFYLWSMKTVVLKSSLNKQKRKKDA